MDHITLLKSSIQYIEQHLSSSLSYGDVAKVHFISKYYFNALFSVLTGITPTEYIRNRRMSLAAQELINDATKVIDLAYKYGYESPDSFTRAFVRFHGIKPSEVKTSSDHVKYFHRVNISITVEGGKEMDYRIEKKESFRVVGEFRNFPVEEAQNPDDNKIAKFWQASLKNNLFERLVGYSDKSTRLGICSSISNDADEFIYGIGVFFENEQSVDRQFDVKEVPAATWAIIPCYGNDPSCIGNTWQRIFKEFLPGSGYQKLDQVDLEVYGNHFKEGVFCEIWLPIE